MEAKLNKLSIDCFKAVFSSTFNREETAESVVPDVLPDIYQIIDADGLVMLRSKEVEAGRVSLSGTIDATVIYLPEGEGGVRKLNVNMPFSIMTEATAVTETTRAIAVLRLGSIDARMLNPRKVLLRADIITELSCYDDGEMLMYDGVAEESKEDIQVKKSSCSFSPIKAVKEKTFVLSDEYQVPASKPPVGELLKKQVDMVVDDVKSVGNKLIFRGVARVGLLYMPIGEGDLVSCMFETSFSQIMEMEGLGEDTQAKIGIMVTGAYFDLIPNSQEGRLMSMELHVVAQAVCYDSSTASYIADAYSNSYPMNIFSEELELMSIERQSSLRETIRENIETSDRVREVIHVYPTLGSTEINGGKIRCSVMVQAIYRNESGGIGKASKRFVVESSVEIDPDMELSISSINYSEAYANSTSGGLELKLPVDISVNITKKAVIRAVTGMELDEETPVDNSQKPSVTVVSPRSRADIWMLAKKYGSTPALILAANEMNDADEAASLLLIPRER